MIFPQDPKIDIGTDGFDTTDQHGRLLDLLGRKEFGQRLTDIVDRIEQPLVIALDGEWGSGKSHFLKLWAGAHKLELKGPKGKGHGQAEVIYFDAFEHDFLDDPLVSLVAKLAKDAPERGLAANAMKKVKTAAAPLLKLGARIGLAVVTAGGAIGDAAIGAIGKTAEEKIDEFWKTETTRIAAMGDFRAALEALTKNADGTTQKIVFIIDELDRCRPDYALQMLEIIKHFFAVPNVHFVLGVNLHALEHSVLARYGQGIDGAKYLQKFVMLTMTLPRAEAGRPEATVTGKYFESVAAHFILSSDLHNLLSEYLRPLFVNNVVSIRGVQRILSVVALLSSRQINLAFGYRALLLGAALLKVLHFDEYKNLRKHTATLDNVAAALKLNPWDHSTDRPRTVRLWIIWAIILDPDALTREAIPKEQIDRYASAFESYGNTFNWRDVDILLAAAFDTFTLPNP